MTASPSPVRPPMPDPGADLYTTEEVAALFRVDPKVPGRWDRAGKFPPGTVIRTLGGHRRYSGDYVRSMLTGGAK
jgi:hypothetical protein